MVHGLEEALILALGNQQELCEPPGVVGMGHGVMVFS
jgi:hypothetical protein